MNKTVLAENVTSASPANVFIALFPFRPREHKTPKENFLSEALVYAVRSCKPAARAWVSFVTDGRIRPRTIKIETRAPHRDPESATTIYPDVSVTGSDQSRKPYRVLVEHKWDSTYSAAQLARYAKTKRRKSGKILNLAFVCEKSSDYDKAKRFKAPPKVRFTTRRWEELYRCLKPLRPRSGILEEFLTFMAAQGLSPGKAISAKALIACAQNEQEAEQGSAFRSQMRRYCDKLKNEHQWTDIPSQYRETRNVTDSYGRCAVIFVDENGLGPEISLGFYYATFDHKVSFVDRRKGIDLCLRVYAPPATNPSPKRVLQLLSDRVPALQKLGARVLLKGQPENGNNHTLLIAQKSLQDVIDSIQDDEKQVAAMHGELSRWCKALFADPRLIKALKTIKPY